MVQRGPDFLLLPGPAALGLCPTRAWSRVPQDLDRELEDSLGLISLNQLYCAVIDISKTHTFYLHGLMSLEKHAPGNAPAVQT